MTTIELYDEKQTPTFDGKLWHVCAWCFPGQSVSQIWPEVDLNRATHGQCPFHLRAMIAEVEKMRAA